MDYLEYFGLTAEPFSHAPVSRFYYASRQHTEALKRLMFATQTMKGLAILIGDIGHGKTTLARRLLDALPASEFEAAMLVVVHAGVTATWLLKRIATQLGVANPPDDKLAILSQLYERLLQIHESGKRAVVIIDEAQMLATRELMEEFRGLLNLEVPEHKLISFVFFGLPDVERNLHLDPPLAQRVALRYHLRPLGIEETTAYVQHRLRLAGAKDELFPSDALAEVHRHTHGVPRVINTLCDNVLLELFFNKLAVATPDVVNSVADNLQLSGREGSPPVARADARMSSLATDDDPVMVVSRAEARVEAIPTFDPDDIAARVAGESSLSNDIDDPLSFLQDPVSAMPEVDTGSQPTPEAPGVNPDAEVYRNDSAAPDEFAAHGNPAVPGEFAAADEFTAHDNRVAHDNAEHDHAPVGNVVEPYAPDTSVLVGDVESVAATEATLPPAAGLDGAYLAVDVTTIKPKLVVPAPTMSATSGLGSADHVDSSNSPLPADDGLPAPTTLWPSSALPLPATVELPEASAALPPLPPLPAADECSEIVNAVVLGRLNTKSRTRVTQPAPQAQPTPSPKVERSSSMPIRTSSGTIDLSEIDELLADIKRR